MHITPRGFGSDGEFGGGERFPFELACAMSDRVKVRLVTFGPQSYTYSKGNLKVFVERPLLHIRGHPNEPLNISFLRHVVWSDVVHCHQFRSTLCPISAIVAKLTGASSYVTDHGGGGIDLLRRLGLGGLIDARLVQSSFADGTMESIGKNSVSIYGGVDTDKFYPSKQKIAGKFAFLGRILPHKGIEHLIRGLPEGSKLSVIGRTIDTDYLTFLQHESVGKYVRFVHDATDIQVVDLLSSAEAVILPSVHYDYAGRHQRFPELLGLVLLEAMSCGTAIVCSNVGGMPEVVSEGVTGFVVNPGSHTDIRSVLNKFLTQDSLAQDMGKAARNEVLRRFTWESVARHCLEQYRG